MSISFARILAKNRSQKEEPCKTAKIILNDRSLLRSQNGLLRTLKDEENLMRNNLAHNVSLPNIKALNQLKDAENFIKLGEDSYLRSKIANELLIKKTESLMAYRLRLRTMLDAGFTPRPVRISSQKSKLREQGSTNAIALKNSPHSSKETPKKFFPKRKTISLARKCAPRTMKTASDPYYYTNITAGCNFTPFYNLLGIYTDNLGNFSYFKTVSKDNIRSEIIMASPELIRKSTQRTYRVENSKTAQMFKEDTPRKNEFLNSKENIKKYWPWVSSIYHNPQKVKCIAKLFIVNFESIVLESNFTIRTQIAEAFKSLKDYFHLIIVTSKSESKIANLEILALFESMDLEVSAIYQIINMKKHSRHIIDYSQIYCEFRCVNPRRDCLIISHHSLCDIQEVHESEIVGRNLGTRTKFHMDRIPIPSLEMKLQPIFILLNNPLLESQVEILGKISQDLIDFLENNYYQRNSFDFEAFMKEKEYKLIWCDLPYKEAIRSMQAYDKPQAQEMQYCPKYTRKDKIPQDETIFNIFII